MTFDQQRALDDYTELQRRISVGAYEERSNEHHLNGTYPEDGIEESIHNLTELAARDGLEFVWLKESSTWTLEPMSEETRAARQEAISMAELIDHVELSADQEADIREPGVIWIHDNGTAQDIRLDAKASTLLLDFLLLHQDRLIRHRDAAARAQAQEYQDTQHYMEHHYQSSE